MTDSAGMFWGCHWRFIASHIERLARQYMPEKQKTLADKLPVAPA